MTIRILFSAREGLWAGYERTLPQALSELGLDAKISLEGDPSSFDYIVFTPNGPVTDLSPYSNVKAVLSLWAGVETMVDNPTLTQPLTRMVDPGLSEGMAVWITGHILRYHLGIDLDIKNTSNTWTPRSVPLARDFTVGILGMGMLGQSTARILSGIGYNVCGWAKRGNPDAPVPVHTGEDGLREILGKSDFIVTLLPDTKETENIVNSENLQFVKTGSKLLNPGRGTLVDDIALIDALDHGKLSHATLDVFRMEPLPQDHPFWSHPNITITPHIAAETRPASASTVIAENIRRCEAGEPLLYLVDRDAGY